ncbi:hypothetical protein A8926_7439 [Saccharopolyspora spinosa]|uniref:Uncharacterized protein n=1 Tax=Saccharopolyspora spinosa TaxID=60894 RepID=A0A2N3Y8Q9_SACSN|nr:hypothetical protein A8926_7439 [Saccharopolyspora spinosa]
MFTRIHRAALAAGVGLLVSSGISTADQDPTTYVLRNYDADGHLVSVVGDTGGAADVACSSGVEYPHYSPPPRAGSVLFKVRVKCDGQGAPPDIHVNGVLGFVPGDPAGPPPPPAPVEPRSVSSQTQRVPVPGEATYYTPAQGQPPVLGSHWYTGGYEAGFVAPIQGPIGNGDTPLVPVTTP